MDSALTLHTQAFMWLVMAGFFMGGNFPECVFPGIFDIFGYGHQVGLIVSVYIAHLCLAVPPLHHDGHLASFRRCPTGLPVRARHASGFRRCKQRLVGAHCSRTRPRPELRPYESHAVDGCHLLRTLRLLLHAPRPRDPPQTFCRLADATAQAASHAFRLSTSVAYGGCWLLNRSTAMISSLCL